MTFRNTRLGPASFLKLGSTEARQLEALWTRVQMNSHPTTVDQVTYTGVHENGEKAVQTNGACFANMVSSGSGKGLINGWEVDNILEPGKTPLEHEQIFEFMQHLTEAGLVPEGITVTEDKPAEGQKRGVVHIIVPRHKQNEQLTYFALCAARWARVHPQVIVSYLKLLKADPTLTAYQLMPLVISAHANNSGHSPINLAYGSIESASRNPFLYGAVAFFAQHPNALPSRSAPSPNYPDGSRKYLEGEINKVAASLNTQFGTAGAPYLLASPAYILHPTFTKLFRSLRKETAAEWKAKFLAAMKDISKKGIA